MFRLREIEKRDIEVINNWRNDPELIASLGAPFRYINSIVDEKWFDSYMNNRNTQVRCAIVDENDVIIGLVSLVNIDHMNQSCVFHIMIGNGENQGKGAGTYATKEMLNHAFNNLNIHRVELDVLADNMRAIHLYEKIGFIKEGTRRQCDFKNGKFVDMLMYSVLREEYLEKIHCSCL